MNKIGIYKITNPLNEVYIGKSMEIEERWERDYKRFKCKGQPKIYKSLKEHGIENHKFEVIEECSIKLLSKREAHYKQQFINKYGWSKALFCEIYDLGGGPRSEITRQKISNSSKGVSRNKGSIFSQEWKDKISKAKKGCKIWSKGKKFTKEHCDKIKNNTKGKSKPSKSYKHLKNSSKKVFQYSLENKFLREWNSAKEAANYFKVKSSSITNCLIKIKKGIKATSCGFIWKYKYDT